MEEAATTAVERSSVEEKGEEETTEVLGEEEEACRDKLEVVDEVFKDELEEDIVVDLSDLQVKVETAFSLFGVLYSS